MAKKDKPKEKTDTELLEFQLNRLRLIFGVFLFIVIIAIHAFVKDLPIWIFAVPSFLFGLDLTKLMGRKD